MHAVVLSLSSVAEAKRDEKAALLFPKNNIIQQEEEQTQQIPEVYCCKSGNLLEGFNESFTSEELNNIGNHERKAAGRKRLQWFCYTVLIVGGSFLRFCIP